MYRGIIRGLIPEDRGFWGVHRVVRLCTLRCRVVYFRSWDSVGCAGQYGNCTEPQDGLARGGIAHPVQSTTEHTTSQLFICRMMWRREHQAMTAWVYSSTQCGSKAPDARRIEQH